MIYSSAKKSRASGGLLVFACAVTLANVGLFFAAQAKARAVREIVVPARQEPGAVVRGVPVDLSSFCNYSLTQCTVMDGSRNHPNNLAALPIGLTNYAGVRFNVSGIIQLGSRESVKWSPPHPAQVTGIPLAGKWRRIHILHGTGSTAGDGLPIAALVLHYENGAERKLPIVYGRHVRDWWASKPETAMTRLHGLRRGEAGSEAESTAIAWVGENEAARKAGCKLRLYRTTFENPLPEVGLVSVDYGSALTGAMPFMCGLSIE